LLFGRLRHIAARFLHTDPHGLNRH